MSEEGLCVCLCASFLLQSLVCSQKAMLALRLLLLLLLLFFLLDEIRSLGSCPALSFACCLAVACYFFQCHLTRGSFNTQGLRTVDTWEGNFWRTHSCVFCFCFFSILRNEGRAMRFRPNTRTRAATECIRKQT